MIDDEDFFKGFRSISKNNANGLFFELIESPTKIEHLKNVIQKIEMRFGLCKKCNYIIDSNICFFCDDDERDKNIICIVSSISDGYRIQKSKFNGLLHVMENNFLDDEKLNEKIIQNIISRLTGKEEIILALNLTFEGEVSSNFLYNKLKRYVNKISRIARGIPFGGSLNYIDYETLASAITNRKKLK